MRKSFLLSILMFVAVILMPQIILAQAETHVTSFGTYNFSGKHFCILSNMENVPSDDVEFMEYAKYISYVFQMRGGIEVSPQSDNLELCILMSYDIKDASYTRTISEPVWGRTGVSSITTSKNFSGGVNYNFNYNYGVVSYKQSQQYVNSFNRYIDLFVYELSGDNKDNQKMVWKAYAQNKGGDGNLFRAFPNMALTFYNAIGSTNEDVWLNVYGATNWVVDLFKRGDLCGRSSTYLPYVENGWRKVNPIIHMYGFKPNVFYLWAVNKISSKTLVVVEVGWESLSDPWYYNNLWYKFHKNTFIRYNGTEYQCRAIYDNEGRNVKFGKIIKLKGNNMYRGSTIVYLEFPPLPGGADVIDVISQKLKDKSSNDDLIWRGVHLRNW